MKRTHKRSRSTASGLAPEYRFDYRKARPNRFAEAFSSGQVAVLLDPDVARVFTTSESVNAMLRSTIKAQPTRKRQKAG